MSTIFFSASALLMSIIDAANTYTLASRSLDYFKRLINAAAFT
jgi:hypothetical protein